MVPASYIIGGGQYSYFFQELKIDFNNKQSYSVFWDLYSATPDRQEKGTSTLEAKAFVDMFHGYGSSLNGGQVSLNSC